MSELFKESAEYILPLHMNGLAGRMLYVPSKKRPDREILLVYGHHALIERWWSLAENLRDYGNVTIPDMPGFGGMQSYSKIGLKPTLDNYADYLAAFIKLRYKRKRISIYAISFGFTVATRMLQRYPELAKKVDFFVSGAGFMHYDDFLWKPPMRLLLRVLTRIIGTRPVSFVVRYGFLNKFMIKNLTKIAPKSKHRYIEVTKEEFDMTMDFEVKIWHANDVRTHWLTTSQFFTMNNLSTPIPLPVYHIVSKGEHYFNNIKVEQHMRQVFKSYTAFKSKSAAHVPHTTAGKEASGVMVPPGLRRLLEAKNN